MPHIDTRHAYHHTPRPQHQPTSHKTEHTQLHPHSLVDNVMTSPFLLGFVLFSAAVAVFLSRRRMRNWISRMVSQAIEAANVPSLHIHIHGQSSSNDYIAVPDSPMSPMFPPFSPFTQTAPTPNTSDSSPINRSIHIDVTPSRPSTLQITHIPAPTKVNDLKSTSRGSLTSITFYPDSPTGSSAPSTPALSECEALSPRSESMPLTPRLSFEEGVNVVPLSPSHSVFSSSTSLDSFRIQVPPVSAQGHMSKHAPISIAHVPEPVARPPSPTTTISIHTTLPSRMIGRARSGPKAPVPPNIVLTSVPRRPLQLEAPLSPPHMLAVPSTQSVRKQRPRQQPRRPITPPPAYEASDSIVDVWTLPIPATVPNPRKSHHLRRHTLKRPPPPPPKPIIPLDLEPVYPSKGTEAEVTPTPNSGPAFAMRRSTPPPVKPVVPSALEPVYPEEKSEKGYIRYSQYDDREDEEVGSPTSATMFFKALVEKGKREMQSLRKEMEENGREERKWGGMSIGARMSAFAKRAKRAVERELDSEDEGEVVVLSPGSPVSRSGWPSSNISTPKLQGVAIPLEDGEVMKEREMVFIIGDEEDL